MGPNSRTDLDRRSLLKLAGASALAAGLSGPAQARPVPAARADPGPDPRRTPALRVAHITDIHIQPELASAQGFAAALRHMQSLEHAPDLVLTGGDHIMDSFSADEARTKLQWQLLRQVLRDECSLPMKHALGNHDIWGWNKGKSGTTGAEPLWGKQWAMDQLGMDRAYHSFDQGGWHFICLDSVAVDPGDANGYIAQLGEEQLAWLADDLKSVPSQTPVLVLSHIPILSVTGLLGRPARNLSGYSHAYMFSGGVMHVDSAQIRAVLARHPNVKACLSGHMHRLDRVEFNGVSYICNGAVSGNWWKGPNHECQEGYAVLDLYADGSFENRYIPYGWTAQP